MPRRSIRILLAVLAVIGVMLAALVLYQQSQPESLIETAPDEQKPFRVNPDQPYEVNFHAWEKPSGDGRGIIVKVGVPAVVRERRGGQDSDGYYREEKSASFTLPPEAIGKILEAVEARGVMNLQGSYKLKDATDGPQMKLFIRQGEKVKRVECSNHFPDELKAFADDLNAIVEPHLSKATWTIKKRDPQ
jgi:hypothetical protein